MGNRNRTLQTLYENDIGNNIMISGDSHANWVSDLVWLDEVRTLNTCIHSFLLSKWITQVPDTYLPYMMAA
jgi:phosphodiesterase/alkaline phosphatase D-like protein